MGHLLIRLSLKQPNILCLLMQVFNVTYKVFLPKISKLDPVKLLDQTTSSQELQEATAPRRETAPGAQ